MHIDTYLGPKGEYGEYGDGIMVQLSHCKKWISFLHQIDLALRTKKYPPLSRTDEKPDIWYADGEQWIQMRDNKFLKLLKDPINTYFVCIYLDPTLLLMSKGRNGPARMPEYMHDCMQLLSCRLHRLECIMHCGNVSKH